MRKPIPIRLDDETIEWADSCAKAKGTTRAAWLRKCIEQVKAVADPRMGIEGTKDLHGGFSMDVQMASMESAGGESPPKSPARPRARLTVQRLPSVRRAAEPKEKCPHPITRRLGSGCGVCGETVKAGR